MAILMLSRFRNKSKQWITRSHWLSRIRNAKVMRLYFGPCSLTTRSSRWIASHSILWISYLRWRYRESFSRRMRVSNKFRSWFKVAMIQAWSRARRSSACFHLYWVASNRTTLSSTCALLRVARLLRPWSSSWAIISTMTRILTCRRQEASWWPTTQIPREHTCWLTKSIDWALPIS